MSINVCIQTLRELYKFWILTNLGQSWSWDCITSCLGKGGGLNNVTQLDIWTRWDWWKWVCGYAGQQSIQFIGPEPLRAISTWAQKEHERRWRYISELRMINFYFLSLVSNLHLFSFIWQVQYKGSRRANYYMVTPEKTHVQDEHIHWRATMQEVSPQEETVEYLIFECEVLQDRTETSGSLIKGQIVPQDNLNNKPLC